MKIKSVGEIMIPLNQFPIMPYWFTLRQAMAELDNIEANKSDKSRLLSWMILVFTADNQLLGVLRQQDILRGLKPNLIDHKQSTHRENIFDVKFDPALFALSFNGDSALASLRKQIERPISEFAQPIEIIIDHDDTIIYAIHLMTEKNQTYVPVIKDKRIVGLVFAFNALEELSKLLI